MAIVAPAAGAASGLLASIALSGPIEGGALLSALYGVIEQARHGHIWGDLKRRSSSRERRQLYQADHRAIVTALGARDADAAIEAMRTHLGRVSGHLLGETR